MYDYRMKNYLAPIQYLVSHFIYEYDISKANLNILYSKGVISKKDYDLIMTFPRAERQIYFGYLQKDKEKAKILNEGLSEFRKAFIETNNITSGELLSVKNDALFLIDTVPQVTKFGNVEFKLKNTYTSFFKLNRLEVYYSLNPITEEEIFDVKGIDDKLLHLHQDYMIEFLCTVFEKLQTGLIKDILDFINEFMNKYIRKELPIQYYREFNADSLYRISMPGGKQYLFETIGNDNFQYLNISTNLNIIRDLYGIVSNIYFNTK